MSFHGEKSIQGAGLSQIHYNLFFIYITMERLQPENQFKKIREKESESDSHYHKQCTTSRRHFPISYGLYFKK